MAGFKDEKAKKKGEFQFKIDDDEDGGQVVSTAQEEFHDSDEEEEKTPVSAKEQAAKLI